MVEEYILNFDGAAVPNPGIGGSGYIIVKSDSQNRVVAKGSQLVSLPNFTRISNNQAEYSGLIEGLRKCVELRINSLLVRGDSQLVIGQMTGSMQVLSENLRFLFTEASALARSITSIRYEAIGRENNRLADELAKRCVYREIRNQRGGNTNAGSENHAEQSRGATTAARVMNAAATNADYSREWIAALQDNKENMEYHLIALNQLQGLPIHLMTRPPRILPPPYTRPTTTQPTPREARRNQNSFGGLNDEVDDEPAIEHRTGGRNARRGQRNGAIPVVLAQAPAQAPVQASQAPTVTIQARYLIARVEAGIVESFRKLAKEAERGRNKDYDAIANNYKAAYSTGTQTLQNVAEWRAIFEVARENRDQVRGRQGRREHAQLLNYHDYDQLTDLFNTLQILVEHTDRFRCKAIHDLERERDIVDARLSELRGGRDTVKVRFGEERWRNNPNPKMDYAAHIIQLREQLKKINDCISELEKLTFEARQEPGAPGDAVFIDV